MLFPFGDPVHAGHAGIFPAGITFLWTVVVCTGYGKSVFPRDLRRDNGKRRQKRHFHGNRLGWEREIRISTAIIWVGTGNQFLGIVWVGPRERYLHGNGNRSQFCICYICLYLLIDRPYTKTTYIRDHICTRYHIPQQV